MVRISPRRKWAEKIAATLLLVVFSPLFVVTALAIKLGSRGPVLFRQRRIGLNEEPFEMFKFRSMRVNAEAQHQELVAQQVAQGGSFLLHKPDDLRTTRVGRIIRKLSIDELPQFLNVIQGNMSFVGPRPMMPHEVEHLSSEQRRRFSVLPGITGLTQINGRGGLPSKDYVGYDLRYIDNYSPSLYWSILLRTPLAVIRVKGAT